MAPSNTIMIHMEEKLLPKEKNKLRKPVVEKMRRDRINSSIEQLKLLLEKEFQRHQPNSKLEKADILEVAVSYLKQQSQLQNPAFTHKNLEQDFNSGYLRCLKEAMHFLSYYEPKKETQVQLIKHFCKAQMAADASKFAAFIGGSQPKRGASSVVTERAKRHSISISRLLGQAAEPVAVSGNLPTDSPGHWFKCSIVSR